MSYEPPAKIAKPEENLRFGNFVKIDDDFWFGFLFL